MLYWIIIGVLIVGIIAVIFFTVSKFSSNVKMFYRRTLPVFKETFSTYDIIVNGIEEVVIGLQKLEENVKNTIDIRFYYPNVNECLKLNDYNKVRS